MTDAPAQLLAGLAELPRYENRLALFPSWLAFLSKVNALKAMATFAVQYWYFAQIDRLGRNGKADPALSVFQATKETTALQKSLVKGRNG